jgi:hypothetical protein
MARSGSSALWIRTRIKGKPTTYEFVDADAICLIATEAFGH